MNQEIWYISKYAVHSSWGAPTRQFFFSKYFARKGRNVTLIGSRSCGKRNVPSFGFKNHVTFFENNIKGILINGPLINLGFNFLRIYSWAVFEIRTMLWALFFKKQKPDVIIVSSLSLLTFITGFVLKKLYGCKLVCEVRDIWPLTLIETKGIKPENIFIKFLELSEIVGYKNADIIVGTMPNFKEYMSTTYPQFVKKVKFVPMGYDPDFYESVICDFPLSIENKIFEIKKVNSFIVGYAGAIGFINYIELIIDTALILRDKPIHFLILGDGPMKKDLEGLVHRENITNVHFLGSVKKENVLHFLKNCDLLVHPVRETKLYKFGASPNKWIDYMHSARPIVVSYNGYQSIINEANCGKFIMAERPDLLANTIMEFSNFKREELDEIGSKGKAFLEKYLNYDVLSDKYLDLIDGIS